jgi:hypothetical protein
MGTCFVRDGAASGVTEICHDVAFPLLTLHRVKYRVYFSIRDFSKRKHCTGVLLIFHTKYRLDIDNFAFDA